MPGRAGPTVMLSVVLALVALLVAAPAAAGEPATDAAGDVAGGPGPDLLAATATLDGADLRIELTFTTVPPIGFDPAGAFSDVVMVIGTTRPGARNLQDATFVFGVHAATLDQGGVLSTSTDGEAAFGTPRTGLVHAAIEGRKLVLTAPATELGDLSGAGLLVMAGRSRADGVPGGRDWLPESGWMPIQAMGPVIAPPVDPRVASRLLFLAAVMVTFVALWIALQRLGPHGPRGVVHAH
jgi:hypothetical protein